MKIRVPFTAAALPLAVAIAIAGCSGGGTSTQPVRGKVFGGTQAAATAITATDSGTDICGGAVTGRQVIVKGPSEKLLATTTLRKDASATSVLHLPASLTGAEGQVGVYQFSTSIPDGNGPYTIDLVGVSSKVVSTKQLGHLLLTCG